MNCWHKGLLWPVRGIITHWGDDYTWWGHVCALCIGGADKERKPLAQASTQMCLYGFYFSMFKKEEHRGQNMPVLYLVPVKTKY